LNCGGSGVYACGKCGKKHRKLHFFRKVCPFTPLDRFRRIRSILNIVHGAVRYQIINLPTARQLTHFYVFTAEKVLRI
jgi:hypothetical protein